MYRNALESSAIDAPDQADLPRAHPVVEAWPHDGPLDPGPARPHLLRVLVVDDCRDAADILSVLVTMWGHEARVAYGGETALQLAADYQPDVLLLDLAMPGVNGCQLARQLRRQIRFKGTLLIATIGYAEDAHRLLAALAGFDLFLVKPIEPALVEALLHREQSRLARARRCSGY